MHRPPLISLLTLLLLAGLSAAAWHQLTVRRALEAELMQARAERDGRSAWAARNAALRAQLPPPSDLAAWREEAETVNALREELAALRRRAAEREAWANRTRAAATAPPTRETVVFRPAACRNQGRTTPLAAVETALWAAASGELDALAETLTLTTSGRLQVEEMLAALTPEMRANYRTPERLVALLAAPDLQVQSVEFDDPIAAKGAADHARVDLRVVNSGGERRQISVIGLRQTDGWKFLVPDANLGRYRARLLGTGGE